MVQAVSAMSATGRGREHNAKNLLLRIARDRLARRRWVHMRAYELMVLIDPEVDERTVEPTLAKFLDVVRNDGGTIDNVDVWGRRRLAYDIKKKNEAIYVVVNFTATPATSAELDRQLSLNETILRTKIIRPEDQKVSAE
jgi:small subunit ribosomal protein S6